MHFVPSKIEARVIHTHKYCYSKHGRCHHLLREITVFSACRSLFHLNKILCITLLDCQQMRPKSFQWGKRSTLPCNASIKPVCITSITLPLKVPTEKTRPIEWAIVNFSVCCCTTNPKCDFDNNEQFKNPVVIIMIL